MKTIKDYLDNLDKSGPNDVWMDDFAWQFDIGYMYGEIKRMKSYFAYSWICTDTEVGLRMYFLDDEFVCASFQPGRKSDETFYWVSKDTREKVLQAVLETIKETENRNFELIDWNLDISSIESAA